MKGRQAVVCPNCGARNSASWEFCARCDEPLEGAQPVEEDVRPSAEEGEPSTSSLPAHLLAVAAFVAVIALGVYFWRRSAEATPAQAANPDLFTIASRPADLPEPTPPTEPGAVDYEEGRRLMNAGDYSGASSLLEAAVEAEPDNAEYRNVYGLALLRGGDVDGALAQHAEAARLDPRFQLQYARSLDVQGKGADAVREYEAILARNPDASTVQEDLGRALYRSGDFAQAAPHLKEAVAARPGDPVLKQELAYALERAGDRKGAEQAYRGVLDQAPDAVLSRGLLAENLVEQGRRDEAAAVLRDGVKRTPDVPLLQRQLGSVLERSGDAAEAAAAYRAYVRLAPNAPDVGDIAARAARLEGEGRSQ